MRLLPARRYRAGETGGRSGSGGASGALTAAIVWFVVTVYVPASHAQVLTEKLLGRIHMHGPMAYGIVVAPSGENLARRERVGQQERYLTLQGPGPLFDQIFPGASWVQGRLVYYGRLGSRYFLMDGPDKISLAGRPTSPLVSPRPWVARDHMHYGAFASDGRRISWYLNGVKQARQYDSLVALIPEGASARAAFAGRRRCTVSVVGLAGASGAPWDILYQVAANPTGTVVFERGERAGVALVERNGKTVLAEAASFLYVSTSGDRWFAIVDRSADGVARQVLLENGVERAQAETDTLGQKLTVSADGTAWVWKIYDADFMGITLRHPGGADTHFSTDPTPFLSADGLRQALLVPTPQNQNVRDVVVDGKTVQSLAGIQDTTFRFGPAGSFAFAVRDQGASVVSQLGAGAHYTEVSEVHFYDDGTPVYIASAPDGHYFVAGAKAVKIAADDVHHLDSFRVEGGTAKVMATRGDEVLALTLSR
jgi:hypothetical protein